MQNDQGCYGIPQRQKSSVLLYNYAGYGSTNTKIPSFTYTIYRGGNPTSYKVINDSVNGAGIQILADGVYAMSFWTDVTSAVGGQSIVGISLNSTQLTTDIRSISGANRVAFAMEQPPSGDEGAAFCSFIGFLSRNDVIRPHTDGTGLTSSADRNGMFFSQIV